MQDLRIGQKYRLLRRLGKGGFGVVYKGVDLETNVEIAIKLEDVRIDPSILAEEVKIYQTLSKVNGVPRVQWHGIECDFNAAVIELLGPNLEDLLNYCGRRFSLKTTLMLADQLIPRIQSVHSRKILHRDIKPENFLLGRGRSGNTVYITDFGLACTRKQGTHTRDKLVGTARFATINGHLGIEQSGYDDLISLGYMLVYFLKGSLPWQGLRASSQERRIELILKKKQQTTAAQLCQDLPQVFVKYFEILCSLRRPDNPPYKQLRGIFRRLFRSMKLEYDNVFDWTMLKFYSQTQSE